VPQHHHGERRLKASDAGMRHCRVSQVTMFLRQLAPDVHLGKQHTSCVPAHKCRKYQLSSRSSLAGPGPIGIERLGRSNWPACVVRHISGKKMRLGCMKRVSGIRAFVMLSKRTK
jgi:hypothetical protein